MQGIKAGKPWEARGRREGAGKPQWQGGAVGRVVATTAGTCSMCTGHGSCGSMQVMQSKHDSDQAHMSKGRGDMTSRKGRSAALGEL